MFFVGIQIARKACGEISLLIHRLLAILRPAYGRKTSLPQFLIGPFRDAIVGLARQPLVNSYARTLPLVWRMGWVPVPEGPLKTELPPLPIEILKEKDVLDEFVRRVNLIGKPLVKRQLLLSTVITLQGNENKIIANLVQVRKTSRKGEGISFID